MKKILQTIKDTIQPEKKPGPLFDRNLVYPCDNIGPFMDLEGEVVKLGEPWEKYNNFTQVSVKVKTERGTFTGWYEGPQPPEIGYRATIRLYDSGGGWYPDDIIVGWSKI